MKKFIAIVAVAVSLAACGTGANTETPTTTDSCKVDSCKATCDSTVVVDTVKAAK